MKQGTRSAIIYTVSMVLFALVALTICLSIWPRRHVKEIVDVTRPCEIRLTTDQTGFVSTLFLRIYGSIDGGAELNHWDSWKLGPGKVDLAESKDWFEKDCVLRYVPKGVKGGRLTVEYYFR